MREYKYQAILHTEDGSDIDYVHYVYGKNKQDAISKIDLMFPFSVKDIYRVNITENRRAKRVQPDLSFVDMGQLAR